MTGMRSTKATADHAVRNELRAVVCLGMYEEHANNGFESVSRQLKALLPQCDRVARRHPTHRGHGCGGGTRPRGLCEGCSGRFRSPRPRGVGKDYLEMG